MNPGNAALRLVWGLALVAVALFGAALMLSGFQDLFQTDVRADVWAGAIISGGGTLLLAGGAAAMTLQPLVQLARRSNKRL